MVNRKPDEPHAPWQIKDFPVALRERAKKAAGKRDESMAEWTQRAVERQLEIEAGDALFGPPRAPEPAPEPRPVEREPLDMQGFGAALSAVTGAYQGAGKGLPLAVARKARAALFAELDRLDGGAKESREDRVPKLDYIAGTDGAQPRFERRRIGAVKPETEDRRDGGAGDAQHEEAAGLDPVASS